MIASVLDFADAKRGRYLRKVPHLSLDVEENHLRIGKTDEGRDMNPGERPPQCFCLCRSCLFLLRIVCFQGKILGY